MDSKRFFSRPARNKRSALGEEKMMLTKVCIISYIMNFFANGHLLANSECVDMMGLIGAGNNPMVGMTVACAVAVYQALNK